MLGLTLREEFRGKRLKGTAIELSNDQQTGATQIAAQQFLAITYPTHDLLKGIEAVGPNQGRPVVVIGERGLGKSHLMAALFHAVTDPASTRSWLNAWATTLSEPKLGQIGLREGMHVIGESLHRHRYKFLWDVLFENHPHGNFIKGKWEGQGASKTEIPSDKLIIELLESKPTMLLLDEFQTWYDGLTNTKQYPWKNWAFNYIQILSEIAKERPDLLVLVISVRNGGSDAYQQVHRVNPVAIDFKAGGTAERIQQDRRRMLLHRLFDNRLQIASGTIESLVAEHLAESFRLLDVPPAEQDRKRREFTESWPYAPHLLRLLEEQVLIATDAQETRDLIRILANLYKSRGEAVPVLTAADFRLDDDSSGIGALLEAVANQHHRTLREKAQQNIISVQEARHDHARIAPHLQEIVGALWLRSIAVGNLAGAEPAALQLDITRDKPVDDNAFQVELATIVENSFNIHQDGTKLLFREEENPRAKLMAYARNDKLFADGADQEQLAKQVRYVIGGSDEVAKTFRVIALPKSWLNDPWIALDETEQPDKWDDRLPILVLPEEPERLDATLGRWLKDRLQKRRNTLRFLLPRAGSTNAFMDRDLLILARAEMKAQEWGSQNPEYKKLHKEFENALRDNLKKRFDRFAVLQRWNFSDPAQCKFSVERLDKQGSQIPGAIEDALIGDLFVPEDFEELVIEYASNNESVGKLLRELQEPRPAGQDCIPWLGETAMKERLLRLCAKGRVAINVRGMEYLQTNPGEDEESAWRRLRPKLSLTGRHLDDVFVMLPSAVPTTGGSTPPAPPTSKVMPADFDPLAIPREERTDYKYEGPEIIYTFWAKHGPCQVMGCSHRTPIMTSPVMALKTLTVKHWEQTCGKCGDTFDVEEEAARMAPDAPLYVAPTETPYSVLDRKKGVICPHCGHIALVNLGKGKNKKVELSLLVHPQWLAGEAKQDAHGQLYGGSAQDDVAATTSWDLARATKIRLLEVRGTLPDEVTDPETGITFAPQKGTVPKRSHYACAACGTVQDVLTSIKATGKTGPMAAYALQGYAPKRDAAGKPYGGRFFAAYDVAHARQYDAALAEWEARKDADLKDYWPRSELPYGFMTHMNNGGIPNHGYTHWWAMFNPRQLLGNALLLKAIATVGNYDWHIREYVLGAFQNYVRNQNMFSFWHITFDKLAPSMSNSNYHPKSNVVEVGVFPPMGYGPWSSTYEVILRGREWSSHPWDVVSVESIKRKDEALANKIGGKSEKVFPDDPVKGADVFCGSSTELTKVADASLDLVITDPPFGGLLHYSELSDFFYVWLRLVLKDKYPDYFTADYTPKSLEAVANRAREPEDPDGFYQRLLTQCWRETHRTLKPGGILAFTFHHSADEPWVAVLESLFEAGYYLEATYPIRSDETKGEGSKPGTFGSQTIEYDIIHVCRKRTDEPKPVSWGRMRREVMADVRQLQAMLENHAKEGLPAADLQVIRRGKALEYFSRHYGKVYVDEGRTISVKEALVGINQLIDEDANNGKEAPPVNAEPMTRQFLRTFGVTAELKRDQLQKFLKGSITTPDEFVQRGWCAEKNKVFTRTDPLEFAREWSGKHRRRLTSDLDQALVLIGACFDNSGINASDTLKNENFKPHVALKPLLEWLHRNGPDQASRNAASRATTIYNAWATSQGPQPLQASLFDDDGEYGE